MISWFKNFVLYRVLLRSSRKIVLPLEKWLTAQLYSWFSIKLPWKTVFSRQNFELHTLVYWRRSFEEYSSQSIQIISSHNYDIYTYESQHIGCLNSNLYFLMTTLLRDYPITKHDKHKTKLSRLSNLNIFLYVQFSCWGFLWCLPVYHTHCQLKVTMVTVVL